MRKFLVSIAVLSTALTAVPAVAQGYADQAAFAQRFGGNRAIVQRFNSQIAQQEQRIQRSAQRGAITRSEHRALRSHAQNLRQRLYNFARNGLTRGEVQDISDRIDNLRDRIRDERRDGRR